MRIASNKYNTVLVSENGLHVWTFGNNFYGQLGHGDMETGDMETGNMNAKNIPTEIQRNKNGLPSMQVVVTVIQYYYLTMAEFGLLVLIFAVNLVMETQKKEIYLQR
jgi:alpha-tubulin suppressor-like RCC1 family protein